MRIRYATISQCGRRSNNEDAFRVVDKSSKEQWMGIVCDGLGGHPMGEVASETIVESICNYYEKHNQHVNEIIMIEKACKEAIKQLNSKADTLNHVNMGTTLVMALIVGNKVTIAHIGDSRCYLVRKDGEIIYQTKDHTKLSFGWEVTSKCFVAYNEEIAVPEINQFDIEPGDRILICSDGLYKSIAPNILTARMTDDKSPEEILDTFAFLCEKNGDDNYTGILAIIEQ